MNSTTETANIVADKKIKLKLKPAITCVETVSSSDEEDIQESERFQRLLKVAEYKLQHLTRVDAEGAD
jgi:hypothetical protein